MLELVGIGNALVDILQKVPEDFLKNTPYIKNSMHLVELETAESLHQALSGFEHQIFSGGSVGNSTALFAGLGGKASFIGKLGADARGNAFIEDMEYLGVDLKNSKINKLRHDALGTGFCQVMITPDHERTMVTSLGAASTLERADLDIELIRSTKLTYLEGYLFDRNAAKACFREAIMLAHNAGNLVAFTLSDRFCIDRHFEDFKRLIHEVDIIFCNENEILRLFETDQIEIAIEGAKKLSALTIITRSAKGALIIDQRKNLSAPIVIEVPAHPTSNIKDMTGAGDAFAAGFLYGFLHGKSHEESGALAAKLASKIISQIGARLDLNLAENKILF